MSSEVQEISSAPVTPRPAAVAASAVLPVPSPPADAKYYSPSLSRVPLIPPENAEPPPPAAQPPPAPKTRPPEIQTPKSSLTPRFLTPLGSPVRKAMRMTKLDPEDAWLPITESRNGNAYYAAFHALCSGIGIQALVLPVSFTILGWAWGIICLVVTFVWQMYTLWILVQIHESPETGMRYSRYLQLCTITLGDKLGNLLALLPILILSWGTCVALILIGGSTSKIFYQIMCATTCTAKPLTPVQWHLVFTSGAMLLSQLPNMNSIAGVSLVGAVTAIGYCTLIWIVSVVKGRLPGVSYDPVSFGSEVSRFFGVLNALGIVAFAFRGHNLILEIQGTMPSSEKHPSRIPMWRGVKVAYVIIAMCLFPLSIGGYWAYGHMIPPNGGMLTAVYAFHSLDTSRSVIGLMSIFVIVNSLTSFQIYGMPIFDYMETVYVKRMKRPCTWWLRAISRAIYAYFCFFVAVAVPFLASVGGLIGGIGLPVTLAYPCFLWLKIKKPKMYGGMWWLNWVLGLLGMGLSGLIVAAGIYVIIKDGVKTNFFKPQ